MQIVDGLIDAAAVTAAVADPQTGATVTFIGTTRDHNDGRTVTRLEYEAYPEMALAEMRKIGDTRHAALADRRASPSCTASAWCRSARPASSSPCPPRTAPPPSRPATSPSTA